VKNLRLVRDPGVTMSKRVLLDRTHGEQGEILMSGMKHLRRMNTDPELQLGSVKISTNPKCSVTKANQTNGKQTQRTGNDMRSLMYQNGTKVQARFHRGSQWKRRRNRKGLNQKYNIISDPRCLCVRHQWQRKHLLLRICLTCLT